MKSLIPAILKVLDLVPFKGYRNLVFTGLLAVNMALQQFGVVPEDLSNTISVGLLPMITYFAAKHE